MILKKLNLVNFRNYTKIEIKFCKNLNIFIGDNASGKTNILESIVILALTKSYRDNINTIKSNLTEELYSFIYSLTERKPIILPIIIDIKKEV